MTLVSTKIHFKGSRTVQLVSDSTARSMMKSVLGKVLLFVGLLPLAKAFSPSALLRGNVHATKSIQLSTLVSQRHGGLTPRPSKWAIAHVVPAYDSASRLQLGATNPGDLIVGYLMIAAACTPYVLSLFFPNFFLKNFFLPVYKDDKDGRDAEIGWKARFATLAFVQTTLVGLEVWLAPKRVMDGVTVLRDIYIAWALFYTDAFLKIRKEAKEGIIAENTFGIQLWHFLVVFVLWADVSQSPLAKAIIAWIMAFLRRKLSW